MSVRGPKDERAAIENTAEDFHTYGLWWIDPNTLRFYYDGEFRFMMNPGTKYNPLTYARPMYMHLVTETYSWEPSLPIDEMLTDDPECSTHYAWVRSYMLVRE